MKSVIAFPGEQKTGTTRAGQNQSILLIPQVRLPGSPDHQVYPQLYYEEQPKPLRDYSLASSAIRAHSLNKTVQCFLVSVSVAQS